MDSGLHYATAPQRSGAGEAAPDWNCCATLGVVHLRQFLRLLGALTSRVAHLHRDLSPDLMHAWRRWDELAELLRDAPDTVHDFFAAQHHEPVRALRLEASSWFSVVARAAADTGLNLAGYIAKIPFKAPADREDHEAADRCYFFSGVYDLMAVDPATLLRETELLSAGLRQERMRIERKLRPAVVSARADPIGDGGAAAVEQPPWPAEMGEPMLRIAWCAHELAQCLRSQWPTGSTPVPPAGRPGFATFVRIAHLLANLIAEEAELREAHPRILMGDAISAADAAYQIFEALGLTWPAADDESAAGTRPELLVGFPSSLWIEPTRGDLMAIPLALDFATLPRVDETDIITLETAARWLAEPAFERLGKDELRFKLREMIARIEASPAVELPATRAGDGDQQLGTVAGRTAMQVPPL